MAHDIGDLVTLTITFIDDAGDPRDPTTVVCTVQAPDGTLTTPSVANPSVGTYVAETEPAASGVWRYKFTGTGAWVAAEEGSFDVLVSSIPEPTLPLSEVEVRERIKRLCAAAYDPELDDGDVDILVRQAKMPDLYGRMPADVDWEATWDINYAVMTGWDIKGAKAAGDFRFEEDQQVFYREQVARHCQAMSKRYNRRAINVPYGEVPST